MCVTMAVGLSALLWAEERVDLSMIHRIKTEAFNNSQVMGHLFAMTDVHGPRLTNSPGFQRSARLAAKQLSQQDPIEYSTRTHHSNRDTYDHVQEGDLMQASAIMASFVDHTAMREELLPRKPLPKPKAKEDPNAPF
jgi:hypothetical protein